MLEGKKIRNFLSTLNSTELHYMELQISVAGDAKRLMKTFGLNNSDFASMMHFSLDECEMYLNGSFEYTIMDLAKIASLWKELEIEQITNSEVNHTTHINTDINPRNIEEKLNSEPYNNTEFKVGSIIRCKKVFDVDVDRLTKNDIYKIISTEKPNDVLYFTIIGDNKKEYLISEEELTNKRLWVLYTKPVFLSEVLESELKVGMNILCIDSEIDLNTAITSVGIEFSDIKLTVGGFYIIEKLTTENSIDCENYVHIFDDKRNEIMLSLENKNFSLV